MVTSKLLLVKSTKPNLDGTSCDNVLDRLGCWKWVFLDFLLDEVTYYTPCNEVARGIIFVLQSVRFVSRKSRNDNEDVFNPSNSVLRVLVTMNGLVWMRCLLPSSFRTVISKPKLDMAAHCSTLLQYKFSTLLSKSGFLAASPAKQWAPLPPPQVKTTTFSAITERYVEIYSSSMINMNTSWGKHNHNVKIGYLEL